MGINRAIVSGNLVRDPELRETQQGLCVLSFRVAVNDRRKNPQTGEWEDAANYVDCTVFGNRAQGLARLLGRGKKVAVEGKLRYSEWQADDGSKRSRLEIVADEVDFMSEPRAEQPAPERPEGANAALYPEDIAF